MKIRLKVFITGMVLGFSVVEMFDFDYCCLDCIPSSHKHISCEFTFPVYTENCSLVDTYLPPDDDKTTISSSSPTTLSTLSSTTNKVTTNNDTTTVTTSANNSTTAQSTDTSKEAKTASPDGYRFKRDDDAWTPISPDVLEKNRINKVELLDAINVVRREWVTTMNVSNMAELMMDDEVEDLADLVAMRCNSINHFCADTPAFEVKILTLNVTFNKDVKLTAQDAINLWSRGKDKAIKKAKKDNIYRKFDKETDSFTSMIWAKTYTIGCADAVNSKIKNNSPSVTYQMTCLLGPAGNKVGEYMFRKGEPCSRCPSNTVCGPYGKLCSRTNYREKIFDSNRTSRCYEKRTDSDTAYDNERQAQAQGRFRDFNTGIKVVLQPRRICDEISSSGTKIINHIRVVGTAVGLLLSHNLRLLLGVLTRNG